MVVWKLTHTQDAGFFTNSSSCGLFATEDLAHAQAKRLQPRDDIRRHEYSVEPIRVLTETYAPGEFEGDEIE